MPSIWSRHAVPLSPSVLACRILGGVQSAFVCHPRCPSKKLRDRTAAACLPGSPDRYPRPRPHAHHATQKNPGDLAGEGHTPDLLTFSLRPPALFLNVQPGLSPKIAASLLPQYFAAQGILVARSFLLSVSLNSPGTPASGFSVNYPRVMPFPPPRSCGK